MGLVFALFAVVNCNRLLCFRYRLYYCFGEYCRLAVAHGFRVFVCFCARVILVIDLVFGLSLLDGCMFVLRGCYYH